MLSTKLEINPLESQNIWSVANGTLKSVDLTTDMLTDFETYKKQAEALYGTPDDPYQNPTADKVLYAYRFTDIDPASWDPQWVAPRSTDASNPAYGRSSVADVQERMNSLLSLNGENGQEDSGWTNRVFRSWLEKQFQASSVGATQDQQV